MKRRWLSWRKRSDDSPVDSVPLTTQDQELRRWANQRMGGGKELEDIELSLRDFEVDPYLTEEEVILAAAAVKREAFSTSVVTAASLVTLGIAVLAFIAAAWSAWGRSTAMLVGGVAATGAVLVFHFGARALSGMGSPAGVQAIVEDRRTRGTLRRLPPVEG